MSLHDGLRVGQLVSRVDDEPAWMRAHALVVARRDLDYVVALRATALAQECSWRAALAKRLIMKKTLL